MFQWLRLLPYRNLLFVQASDIPNSLPKRENVLVTFKPPAFRCIVIVIQSEHLKHSISPRNQSAKHPDSGCFGISGVVIGSVLSKGWRSGPEAFRAGHFLRLDRNRKPLMKSRWHPGYVYRHSVIKSFYKIPKIVRALWLAERRVCMRVCKHGCDVKMFCFSRANHASTNLKKDLSWKTRQVCFI